jgi:hypothetical protein
MVTEQVAPAPFADMLSWDQSSCSFSSSILPFFEELAGIAVDLYLFFTFILVQLQYCILRILRQGMRYCITPPSAN